MVSKLLTSLPSTPRDDGPAAGEWKYFNPLYFVFWPLATVRVCESFRSLFSCKTHHHFPCFELVTGWVRVCESILTLCKSYFAFRPLMTVRVCESTRRQTVGAPPPPQLAAAAAAVQFSTRRNKTGCSYFRLLSPVNLSWLELQILGFI